MRSLPVQIHEELAHPLIHDFVVLPAADELFQQVLPVLVAESRQDCVFEVLLEGLSVPLVELFTPVIGAALSAHVVAGGVGLHKVFGREEAPLAPVL